MKMFSGKAKLFCQCGSEIDHEDEICDDCVEREYASQHQQRELQDEHHTGEWPADVPGNPFEINS